MTISELTQQLLGLQSAIQDKKELIRLIEVLAAEYRQSQTAILEILETTGDREKAYSVFSSLGTQMNVAGNTIRAASFSKIFYQIEQLKDVLDLNPNVDKRVELINGALSVFREQFESAIRHNSVSENAKLISVAHGLRTLIDDLLDITKFLSGNVNKHIEQTNDEQQLVLLLPYTDEYDEIILKLNALNELYSELCSLFNISTTDYPLRVIKIETGSLWIQLLGNAVIIGFIVWLLKAAIGYVHRTFTDEGKVLAIPRQMEAADSILQFTKKLDELGVDTTQNKEELQKVAFTATRNLNQIVSKQSSIKINDELFSVGDALEQKFLEESKTLLLEDGTQEAESSTEKPENS